MSCTTKHSPSELSTIGIIGKDVLHLGGFDPDRMLVLRLKMKRLTLIATFDKLPRCIVGIDRKARHLLHRLLASGFGYVPKSNSEC